ncbi:MAG: alpha/beta fold hydrolase [Bacteroidia bacterium]
MKIFKRILLGIGLLLCLGCVVLGTQFRADIPRAEMVVRYGQSPSQFMTLAGQEIHFRDQGQGPALLLLHGMGASLHTWDQWTAALQDSFRVIRVDLPAYGLTGANPQHDYSLDAYITFIHDLIERLGLDSVSIIGNSLGGAIAWNYAAVHPDKVHKLVLIDAWGFPDPSRKPTLGVRLAGTPILQNIVRYITPRSLIEKSIYEVYGDESKVTEAIVDRYYDMMLAEGNRAAFIARQDSPFPFIRERLDSVYHPTLLQWGEEDSWIPLAIGEKFMQALPNAQLISYPGVGHLPMEEIPQRTVGDARRFLED